MLTSFDMLKQAAEVLEVAVTTSAEPRRLIIMESCMTSLSFINLIACPCSQGTCIFTKIACDGVDEVSLTESTIITASHFDMVEHGRVGWEGFVAGVDVGVASSVDALDGDRLVADEMHAEVVVVLKVGVALLARM